MHCGYAMLYRIAARFSVPEAGATGKATTHGSTARHIGKAALLFCARGCRFRLSAQPEARASGTHRRAGVDVRYYQANAKECAANHRSDRMNNAIAMLKGRPTEKQKEFFRAKARHVAYGGARGGGKSWAARRKLVGLALSYAGLRLLLLRRSFPELLGNHIKPLIEELVPTGIATYTSSEHIFTFPNGSYIKLGFCNNEDDWLQYQGQEYEVICFEEATQFTEMQMVKIATSNRTTRTDFKPRCYYTCNPGGPGHDYIKRVFVDRDFITEPIVHNGVEIQPEDPDDYVFIQAKVEDNPYILDNDPGYIKTLAIRWRGCRP